MVMHTLTVTYPMGKYPIYIGKALFNNSDLLRQHIRGQQIMLITNETIAPLYLSLINNLLTDYQFDSLIIPDGERYKSLTQFSGILDELIKKRHHRDTTLIALGGGVVGDMTGFAAACFHRGVDFIQIPTTLLAQVDASIGGKTAINHAQGKNLIGAFHQPAAVFIDIDMLASLPDRHYHAGLAEIIKAALIRDADFFNYLERNIDGLMQRQSDILLSTIAKACTIKRDIVAIDEKERNIRALLNLGHTFGHAIEQNMNYRDCLHGEAVAIGMVLAATLSASLNWLTTQDVDRIIHLLQLANLPTKLPSNIQLEPLITAMYSDKKILDNRIHLILLQAIGKGIISKDIGENKIRELIEHELAASEQNQE